MITTRRVALVTGGTRGLGRVIVERLLGEGWRVLAISRHGHWEGERDECLAVCAADIRDPLACEGAVTEAVERWGQLDHLVNNAAVVADAPMRAMTLEDWEASLGPILTGTFAITKAALEEVTASERGRIVNIGSVAGSMGSTRQVNYSAAKAGLVGFTAAVAREVAGSGTTVNLVVLGATDAGIGATTDPRYVEAIKRKIPLGRLGAAGDVAHAVRFLLDDDSGYITGASLAVDGGLSMG